MSACLYPCKIISGKGKTYQPCGKASINTIDDMSMCKEHATRYIETEGHEYQRLMTKSEKKSRPSIKTPTVFGRQAKPSSTQPGEKESAESSERSLLVLGAYACLKQYETFVTSSLADVSGLTESLVKMPNFEETLNEVIDDLVPEEGIFEASDPYKRLGIMIAIATWSQINVNKLVAATHAEPQVDKEVPAPISQIDDVIVTSNNNSQNPSE